MTLVSLCLVSRWCCLPFLFSFFLFFVSLFSFIYLSLVSFVCHLIQSRCVVGLVVLFVEMLRFFDSLILFWNSGIFYIGT